VSKSNPIELAGEIVTAFVSNNSVPRGELPALIEAVHAAVKMLAEGADVAAAVVAPPEPAVSIRKSVTPDFLICLEDGKRFKSLRRHLAGLGMTPEQYREKWNLPETYPMVAPNYAAQRSALAKDIGLGQLRRRNLSSAPSSVGSIEPEAFEPANKLASEQDRNRTNVIYRQTPEPVIVETIQMVAPDPVSVVEIEFVSAATATSETIDVVAPETISAVAIEAKSFETASAPKRKARAKKGPS